VEFTRAKDAQRASKAGMGGVAARGAAQVRAPGAAAKRFDRGAPVREEGDKWIDDGSIRDAARAAVERQPSDEPRPKRRPKALPGEVVAELTGQSDARRAPRLVERLGEALTAFDSDRYGEARAVLSKLAAEAPAAAAVRELHGLTLYRMERWKPAALELEAYRTLTGETDQHPVLADCYRALGRHNDVDELWEELRQASPSAEIMAEGRIVVAGSLADRGRLPDAIALLERSLKATKRLAPLHLRQWYALADLYDRAGETVRARSLFQRIRDIDPEFADTADRLKTLGR